MGTKKEELRAAVREWANTPKEERITKKAKMKELGIKHIVTFNKYLNNGTDDLVDKLASLDEFQIEQFFKRVYDRAMEPKATAKHMELFAKLKGLLIERKENVNIDVSGDELTRRNLEAERQLREAGYRVAEVQDKPPLLPEDVRPTSGQSVKGDN